MDHKKSRVSKIVIPIPNYTRPDIWHKDKRTFPYFVGRTAVLKKLKDLLTSTPDKGAAYLLVGARGMGKTTVVNKAIQEIKSDLRNDYNYTKVAISLSNENFEEIDIYRIIGKRFISKFLESPLFISGPKWTFLKGLTFVSFLLNLLTIIFSYWTNFQDELWRVFGVDIIKDSFKEIAIAWSLINLFVILIIGCFIFWFWFSRRKKFKLRKKARILLDRIESDVTVSESLGVLNKGNPFNLGFHKSKKYPIADIRFIEHELINLINQIGQVYGGLRYIFVFDELDKIESGEDSISEERNYDKNTEENQTRRQQRAIIDILGNFKYFLNHARAKFIFIAGREMTDASMADISKRNFYLRSIFDEIIHLDSLLKEDIKRIDLRVSSAIELYVYGIIYGDKQFGEGSQVEITRLKKEPGGKSLEELVFEEVKSRIKPNNESSVNRYKSFLKDFILYLTFRSHGSPRLLFQYFEKYVRVDYSNVTKEKEYRLEFDFNQQMIIGMVAYLYRGLIRNHYNTTIGNSDKLLTNLPFIFDHVLKYHDFAFSWRSLELLPEVIDVNKSPNLRHHISTVVDYLEGRYVKEISNGLFEYKFHKTTANEIKYASEISKTSRAAFNFTLDESLPLKKYYGLQIDKLLKNYSQLRDKDYINSDYIHSLGFYYIVLGDLHFYDKEYDKAIENYNNAVQPFRQKSLNNQVKSQRIRSHEFIIYVRGMLKLTLTFERMKLYDSVFTYLEWTNRNVINYFNIKSKKKAGQLENLLNKNDFRWSSSFQFNNQLIFIDGFLNALYVAEKASTQGVTQADLDASIFRFDQVAIQSLPMIGGAKISKWYFSMLRSHFFNQLGHLLFYKNGFLPGRDLMSSVHRKQFNTEKKERRSKLNLARLTFESIVVEFNINKGSIDDELPKFYNIPVSAYYEYYRCLSDLLEDSFLDFDPNNLRDGKIWEREKYLLIRYSDFLYSDRLLFPHNYQSQLFHLVANYISDLANTVLSLTQEAEVNNEAILDTISRIDEPSKGEHTSKSGLKHILECENSVHLQDKGCRFLLFTYLAGLYYKRINKQTEYAHTMVKILYVIRYNVILFEKALTKDQMEVLYSKIGFPALRATFISCRYRDVDKFLFASDWESFMKVVGTGDELRELVEYPEAKEIIMILFEITLGSDSINSNFKGEKMVILNNDWVHSDTLVNNSFSRTMELRYKAYTNQFYSKKNEAKIIADSIWCLRKVRTNLQVYGISYITNHYLRAEASHQIGCWLEKATKDIKTKKDVESILIDVYEVGMDKNRREEFLDPKYHYREAIDNYRSSIQLHSQGECYYKTIKQMYYLEGDFDDKSSHFCATLDRYRINAGAIERLILRCQKGIDRVNGFGP